MPLDDPFSRMADELAVARHDLKVARVRCEALEAEAKRLEAERDEAKRMLTDAVTARAESEGARLGLKTEIEGVMGSMADIESERDVASLERSVALARVAELEAQVRGLLAITTTDIRGLEQTVCDLRNLLAEAVRRERKRRRGSWLTAAEALLSDEPSATSTNEAVE